MKNKDTFDITIEEATKIVRDLARFKGKNKVPYASNVALRIMLMEGVETIANDYNSNIPISQLRELKEATKEATTIFREEYPEETKELTDEDAFFYVVSNSPKEYREAAKEANGFIFYMKKVIDKSKELKEKERELNEREAKLEAEKTGSYKVAGHLIDQRLKYAFPTDNLPSIFDQLKEATIEDMIDYGVEVEGIRLTATETKIVDCICKLLDESRASTKYNESSSTELAENVAPKLFFTLYELTKEYKGGESVSGKDVANVKTILEELSYKSFLIRYKEVTTNIKTKEKTIKEYEQVRSLINIDKATLTKEKEGVEHYKKVETVVNLHPIFLKQIDSKFILYPNDINKRTIVAYGSHNVSDMTLRLRDYLMREISSKRKKSEIGLEKLYYLLNEKWMNESRKKRVKEGTEKAIETVKNMELITSHEITTNVKGEAKVVFHLNKEWK